MPIDKKIFFSHAKVNPSISPFIKNRIRLICKDKSLEGIIQWIIDNKFSAEGFKVSYVPIEKVDEHVKDGKAISKKKIGFVITGFPSFVDPAVCYSITCYKDEWLFGEWVANNMLWRKHNNKPHSYSSSLGLYASKVLLNIAAKGDTSKKMIDPCCGVGTVLIEGCFGGYDIEGRDIKEKVAKQAQINLSHFAYKTHVACGDIRDIGEQYDASIIDLPYGNFSHTDEVNQVEIIRNGMRIANRMVVVVPDGIHHLFEEENIEHLFVEGMRFRVVDSCRTYKNKSRKFVRHIMVCERV